MKYVMCFTWYYMKNYSFHVISLVNYPKNCAALSSKYYLYLHGGGWDMQTPHRKVSHPAENRTQDLCATVPPHLKKPFRQHWSVNLWDCISGLKKMKTGTQWKFHDEIYTQKHIQSKREARGWHLNGKTLFELQLCVCRLSVSKQTGWTRNLSDVRSTNPRFLIN